MQILPTSTCVNWWLVINHLSGCLWLFALKFWEGTGTYELLFCSQRIAASVALNFVLYALAGGGDAKTSLFSLVPHTSHLVKRSLSKISNDNTGNYVLLKKHSDDN